MNARFPASTPVDTLHRPLRDLRISITDRCNLRCTYCMPREAFGKEFAFLPRAELLSFEEITRLAAIAVTLGVRKIRLSGGEPLLRHGVEGLIERLAGLRTPEGAPVEVAMTTNGVLLARRAQALKNAGLTRLTVSLDGLNQAIFERMSDSKVAVATVLEGVAAAQAAGLTPLKVNAVIKRGANENEILPLVRHFRRSGVILRFIEFMDVGTTNGWRMDHVLPAQEILARIDAEFPLRPLDANYPGEVAKRWTFADGGGEIGVIASVTQAFCHECARLRLSTDGKLYTCLFAIEGIDLRTPLRAGETDAAVRERLIDAWRGRTDRYSQLRQMAVKTPGVAGRRIEMSYIGG